MLESRFVVPNLPINLFPGQQLKREYEKMLLRELDFVGFSGVDVHQAATEFRGYFSEICCNMLKSVEMARGYIDIIRYHRYDISAARRLDVSEIPR